MLISLCGIILQKLNHSWLVPKISRHSSLALGVLHLSFELLLPIYDGVYVWSCDRREVLMAGDRYVAAFSAYPTSPLLQAFRQPSRALLIRVQTRGQRCPCSLCFLMPPSCSHEAIRVFTVHILEPLAMEPLGLFQRAVGDCLRVLTTGCVLETSSVGLASSRIRISHPHLWVHTYSVKYPNSWRNLTGALIAALPLKTSALHVHQYNV